VFNFNTTACISYGWTGQYDVIEPACCVCAYAEQDNSGDNGMIHGMLHGVIHAAGSSTLEAE
jgi:hypothetical protein